MLQCTQEALIGLDLIVSHIEDPEDLIGACLYFASAESDFTTGQTLVIDGGGAMW